MRVYLCADRFAGFLGSCHYARSDTGFEIGGVCMQFLVQSGCVLWFLVFGLR